MGRVVWIVLLALVLPLSALADSSNQVDFGNTGGTLTGSDAGMSLGGSTLTSVVNYDGLGTITGNDLGSLSFTTGALLSGNLQNGATFAGGGSFQIATNGTNGLPDGVIFTGSFSGDVSWQALTLSNGTKEYTLTGPVSGMLVEGNQNIAVVGLTVQLTVSVSNASGNVISIMIASGNTNLTPVPEPGTLGLLGTGLLGIGVLVRQKLKSRGP
ncbi:MAG: PEP-CTERM sorting domain-containing protein [Terriglobales bacterium]